MELNQTSIEYYERRLERIAVCTETTDMIVPDSFPDVGRVVCAYGTPAIRDQTPQNGRLLVSGTVQAVILYEPEGGGLRRLAVPVSFAHIEECDGLDADAVCAASCQTASVEADAVNSRKLSISLQLCFSVSCYCKAACEITEDVALPGIQLRSAMQSVTLVEQARAYPLTVLDDILLQEAEGLSLLHAACTMRVAECRAMRGKAVLKGEAAIRCLALQEDGAVRVLTGETPFTQILELPEAAEGDAVHALVAVRESDCTLEAEGLLSCTISASALITLRRTRPICRIDDLYLPGRTLRLQEEKTVLHSMPPLTPFSAEASETIPTARHVSHIVCAGAVCCGAKRGADDGLQITAAVQALYLTEEQQLCSVQRMLPLSMPCGAAGEVQQIELSARAAPAGESGLAVTVAASGMAGPGAALAFRHIAAVEPGEEQAGRDGVTLLLRYVDQEQELWDIAKDCGATVDGIRRANHIGAEVSGVRKTMLLIPIQA